MRRIKEVSLGRGVLELRGDTDPPSNIFRVVICDRLL
jgi:hypothetical protein